MDTLETRKILLSLGCMYYEQLTIHSGGTFCRSYSSNANFVMIGISIKMKSVTYIIGFTSSVKCEP